jgi:hypothetical protein
VKERKEINKTNENKDLYFGSGLGDSDVGLGWLWE